MQTNITYTVRSYTHIYIHTYQQTTITYIVKSYIHTYIHRHNYLLVDVEPGI